LGKPPTAAADVGSCLNFNDEKKADVLTTLLTISHNNIISWTTRSYQAAVWSIGINFTVISYVLINYSHKYESIKYIVAFGLLIMGIMTQFYLKTASRAHSGNRLTISKCEGALKLYKTNNYLQNKSFFVFSEDMLKSKNLEVLKIFHFIVTILSINIILFLEYVLK